MPKAIWNEQVIAEVHLNEIQQVEGNIYFPASAVKSEFLLLPSDTHTACGWKGVANPVTLETFVSTNPGNSSNTEAIAAALPGAQVAKAFNMAHTSVWEDSDMTFDGRQLVALFTSDDKAVETVATLIVDTGAEPLLLGNNSHAYQLEAAAAIVIKFLFSGRAGATVLNLIQPEIKDVR